MDEQRDGAWHVLPPERSQRTAITELIFPEMESILLNCLPRPRIGVFLVPQVISSFDMTTRKI